MSELYSENRESVVEGLADRLSLWLTGVSWDDETGLSSGEKGEPSSIGNALQSREKTRDMCVYVERAVGRECVYSERGRD